MKTFLKKNGLSILGSIAFLVLMAFLCKSLPLPVPDASYYEAQAREYLLEHFPICQNENMKIEQVIEHHQAVPVWGSGGYGGGEDFYTTKYFLVCKVANVSVEIEQ